jgi:hypothetical protein
MYRLVAWCRNEWPTFVVVALGVAIQIFLITRPLDFLITNLLPDDAFYAFEIARNIAHGLGSTFDGINATDGYHPLWILVLVPAFKWFSTGGMLDLAPVRVALALSVAMNAATALFVARILARFSQSRWIRVYGMVVWMLNPFLLYETLNGLETSLALLLFAIFFLLALRIEEGKAIGGYWLIGIAGGFMILARLDMIMYFAALIIWMFVREGMRVEKKAVTAGVCAAVPVLAWVVWNFVTFHTLLTSSSSAEQMVNHQLIVQDHGSSIAQALKAAVYTTQGALVDLMQRTGMYSIALGLVGAFAALLCMRSLPFPRWKHLSASSALFFGFILLFAGNATIRWTVREWYFVSFDIFLAILAVVVLGKIFPQVRYRRSVGALLLLLTIFSFGVDWSKDVQGAMAGQRVNYAAAQWMSANLPAGTSVGVFNAGIEGYFSSVRIVNLDGLVNNAAYDAMREHALWAYVRGSDIAYVADFDLYLTYRYKSFFGADPYQNLVLVHGIATETGPHGAGALNIYRVVRQ